MACRGCWHHPHVGDASQMAWRPIRGDTQVQLMSQPAHGAAMECSCLGQEDKTHSQLCSQFKTMTAGRGSRSSNMSGSRGAVAAVALTHSCKHLLALPRLRSAAPLVPSILECLPATLEVCIEGWKMGGQEKSEGQCVPLGMHRWGGVGACVNAKPQNPMWQF
jgi:hypothetical protein